MSFVDLVAPVRKLFDSSGIGEVLATTRDSGKTVFSTLSFGLAILAAAIDASVANAGVLYVLSGSGSGPNFPSFGKVDVSTGLYTEVQGQIANQYVSNLSWNPSLSAFYTIDGDADEPPVLLSIIDTSGTISSSASPMGSRTIVGMAYRQSDSTIYAYDSDGNDYGKIDPGTGAWSNLLTFGHGIPSSGNFGGRFAILNDTLYLTGVSGTNGVFGTIGFTSSSTFTQMGGTSDLFKRMVLASDGTNLFGIFGDGTDGNQALYSIDPVSGTPSYITAITGSGLGTRFYGAAFQPSNQPVPEPSMSVISLFGMACVGFARRIKAKRLEKS